MDTFYDNDSIIKYLSHMAYLNIISYCLLSGCSMKKYKRDEKSRFSNVSIGVGLYKKALPQYIDKPENLYDFNTYQWKDKKIKKTISSVVQSLSILSMNLSARRILDGSIAISNGEYIAYYFTDAAVEQLNFMYNNLSSENLIYDCKLKKNESEIDSLEIAEERLDILSQYYACEAAALTQDLLGRTSYDKKLSKKCKDAVNFLLPDLCHIAIKDSLYTSSRNLCQICDSLLNIYEYTDINKTLVYNTVNILGQELCERLSAKGEILRRPDDNKISSFFTLLIALSCLSRLYLLCGFDNYIHYSRNLFNVLCTQWSEEDGIFIKNGENKIEYSIKEVGAILSALKNFRKCAEESIFNDLDRMMSGSFKNMILKSGIFINQSCPILGDEKMNLPKGENSSKKSPPVFLDKIEYKKSKKKFKLIDKRYNAEHSLWACRQLL